MHVNGNPSDRNGAEPGPPAPASPVRGGPRTPAGKAASRTNALRHGLTATKLLPQVLQTGRVDLLREQLREHFRPRNQVETLLVDEMARHGAMLEFGEAAEGAVLRRGAQELTLLAPDVEGDQHAEIDVQLAAAVSSDALERFARYRRGHERAFFAALAALRDLQARPSSASAPPALPVAPATEADCEAWLYLRVTNGHWCCPHCSATTARQVVDRRVVQCTGCRRQFGIRTGTVMVGSPLPLTTWFSAVQLVLANPKISAAELGRRLGLLRSGTAQRLLAKILRALEASDATRQLMGMNVPVNGGSRVETGVSGNSNPRNEPSGHVAENNCEREPR